MLELQQLLQKKAVLIQCHDNPDADAIGSGFALLRYLEQNGVAANLVYAGFRRVSKPNLTALVEALDIPLDHVGKAPQSADALLPGHGAVTLVTVDCQHGAGNVTNIPCGDFCIIDHHQPEVLLPPDSRVEPHLGSCATVVWQMLREAGFDFAAHRDVSTALYYGLYTDTNSLAEIFHPVDKDMLESLSYDAAIIKRLKNNNLTREEILIAAGALAGSAYDEALGTNLFLADPCDPNILGFTSDLTLQVQGVQVCVGCCEAGDGHKLSLRSATHEVAANELAAFLTQGRGSGGGGREKAGGFLRLDEGVSAKDYLTGRLEAYFQSYDKLVAGADRPDTSTMKRYRKMPVPVGYAVLSDLFPAGTEVVIRTLEGDAVFTTDPDSYVMVGIQGEAYPIDRARFEASYKKLEGRFAFPPELVQAGFYPPTVKERLYGKTLPLEAYLRPCVPSGESTIYAKPLTRTTKVFAKWYTEGYMLGKPGDWLACRADDPGDIYIIGQQVFALTYEEAQ